MLCTIYLTLRWHPFHQLQACRVASFSYRRRPCQYTSQKSCAAQSPHCILTTGQWHRRILEWERGDPTTLFFLPFWMSRFERSFHLRTCSCLPRILRRLMRGVQCQGVPTRGHPNSCYWGCAQFTKRTSSYVVVLSQQQKKEQGEVSSPLNFPEQGVSVHSAMKACRSVMCMGSWVWCLIVS